MRCSSCPATAASWPTRLAEALWLAETYDDVVVGYPSADRASIARLAADERLAKRVTIMVDDIAQLDFVDAVAAPGTRAPIRVCLELDASYQSRVLGFVGVRRSPVREPAAARALAAAGRRAPRIHAWSG